MKSSRRLVPKLIVTTLVVVACTSAPATSQPPIPSSSPSIQVITGVDANHQVILEPLRQVIPDGFHNPAHLAVFFADYEGVHLGIEGAKLFLKATTAAGTVVLDRIVDATGDVQGLPADDYTLMAYYRTCDANCGFLDPAVEFCSTVQTLEADRQYLLTVRVNAKTCAVVSN